MIKIILMWVGVSVVLMAGYLWGFAKGYNQGADDERSGKLFGEL